jgi:hypothetical protein
VTCHRPRRRQPADTRAASRANHAPAQAHQKRGLFFLRITVGSQRCRPSAALARNVLRVGECVYVPQRCVAFACQRLVTATADMHMAHMSWSWARWIIERVTRGRVKKVQVLLQRRVCCAVRCACRASAFVRCVFDACGRKRWLFLRCVVCRRPRCRRTRYFGLCKERRQRFCVLPSNCRC